MAEITNNEQWHRFEYPLDEDQAIIQYSRQGKNFLLEHTEVPEKFEGQGIAREMVEKTFTWLENNGFSMTPYCPYILNFVKRHPEWKRIEVAAQEEE